MVQILDNRPKPKGTAGRRRRRQNKLTTETYWQCSNGNTVYRTVNNDDDGVTPEDKPATTKLKDAVRVNDTARNDTSASRAEESTNLAAPLSFAATGTAAADNNETNIRRLETQQQQIDFLTEQLKQREAELVALKQWKDAAAGHPPFLYNLGSSGKVQDLVESPPGKQPLSVHSSSPSVQLLCSAKLRDDDQDRKQPNGEKEQLSRPVNDDNGDNTETLAPGQEPKTLQQYVELKAEMETRIQSLKAAHIASLQERDAVHEWMLCSERDVRKKLQEKYEQEINSLKEKHVKELRERDAAHTAYREEQEKVLDATREKHKTQLELRLQESETQHASALTNLTAKLESALTEKLVLNEQIIELRRVHKLSVGRELKALREENRKQMEQTEKQHSETVRGLENSVARLQAQMEKAEKRAKRRKERADQLEKQMTELKSNKSPRPCSGVTSCATKKDGDSKSKAFDPRNLSRKAASNEETQESSPSKHSRQQKISTTRPQLGGKRDRDERSDSPHTNSASSKYARSLSAEFNARASSQALKLPTNPREAPQEAHATKEKKRATLNTVTYSGMSLTIQNKKPKPRFRTQIIIGTPSSDTSGGDWV